MLVDFLIHNIGELLTCSGPAPKRGQTQGDVRAIAGAAIAAHRGRIVFVGTDAGVAKMVDVEAGATIVDARGGSVVPGFVDPHTHVVFAGDRQGELRRRLAGATYSEIAASGGGILATVAATRAASDADLAAATRPRLEAMLQCGTTTAEAKSGYGLSVDSELKMLRVVAQLGDQPIELAATFMGAHEIGPEWRTNRRGYLELLIDGMIPRVARDRLAEWCDVFCEPGAFTVDESREILRAAKASGLKPRIHAEEFAPGGGARLAAELGARSADHLVCLDDPSLKELAAAGVIATLLPIAAFYLKLGRFAPARRLIAAAVPVALATDVNPGAGLSPSMPFAISLACFAMNLTFEEALVASTINAACALDRQDRVGSLEVGKQMDAVLVAGPPIDLVRVGVDTIRTVVKRGQLVYAR
jgi:imidazolonepropionase